MMQPFQKIKAASAASGFSQCYLRKGCKDGTIPHIRSGNDYYINMVKLFEMHGISMEVFGNAEK